MALPLEGIRIVDLTLVLAGPYGAMMLADMGAEVIRVESTQYWQTATRGQTARPTKEQVARMGVQGGAYPDRDPGAHPWNRAATFNTHSRNKLSMTVNLRDPEGVEIFKKLISVSDVFVENNAAGVVERLGIGYEALREVNPRLIMVSSSGFGHSGPYSGFHGYGHHFEAMIGHTWLRGYPDSDPSTTTNVVLSDASAGAAIALSVVMALFYRNRTGKGQFIDMAQAEVLVPYLWPQIMDYVMNGRVPGSLGNRDAIMAPQGAYPCRGEDSWLTLSIANDSEFAALCQLMGRPELAEDPRFATVAARHANHDALDECITAWTVTGDHHELAAQLQRAGIAAGPILSNAEIVSDPQLEARGFLETVTHPEAGTHRYPGPLWKLSRTPASIRRPAPLLGEHNRYVYQTLLGYSDADYARLERAGHIGTEPAPHIP